MRFLECLGACSSALRLPWGERLFSACLGTDFCVGRLLLGPSCPPCTKFLDDIRKSIKMNEIERLGKYGQEQEETNVRTVTNDEGAKNQPRNGNAERNGMTFNGHHLGGNEISAMEKGSSCGVGTKNIKCSAPQRQAEHAQTRIKTTRSCFAQLCLSGII